ncbi:DUF397 domain-containing protein [Nocardia sp. BMG111209]|uniref:DUF397 domain-containing protein n=1 Tax=Nocardia sp. BMG111209 TaxID=1160137 RepID=UPI0018CA83BD|nr:DUF397 domain-containing protein [Nocardia sp. BMG111209]
MTAPRWFKAIRSGNMNCVEIAFTPEATLIRDSKYLRNPANDPDQQPILRIATAQWPTFLTAVQYRTTAGTDGLPSIAYSATGNVSLSDGTDTLTYTLHEWEAFSTGVLTGEFDRAAVAV